MSIMKESIQTRLQELQTEYQKGQERLSKLDQEMATVKTSMLRISGAIQVLEEMLKEDAKEVLEAVEVTPNGLDK